MGISRTAEIDSKNIRIDANLSTTYLRAGEHNRKKITSIFMPRAYIETQSNALHLNLIKVSTVYIEDMG